MLNTLLLYPSLNPHRRTDGLTDWWRNEYTCFAWAEGTFFPVVLLCCVSVWFLREQGFWSTVCLLGARFWQLRQEKKRYSRLSGGLCCCVSFWFWQEISIFFVGAGNFDYDRKKKIQSSVGRKLAVFLLWQEIFITIRKKRYITTGKKRYSRLSNGCAVLAITTGKKKRYSRLSGGLCCYISFWFLAGN